MDIIHNDPIWQKKKHILKKKNKQKNAKHTISRKWKKKSPLKELNPTNHFLSTHILIDLKRLRNLSFQGISYS